MSVTCTIKGQEFRFVSFGGGNTVTVAKDGKFYCFDVKDVDWKKMPFGPQTTQD